MAGKLQGNVSTKEKRTAHTLMILLVCNWGVDYSMAKWALELVEPMQLIFFKYFLGFFVFLTFKLVNKIPWTIEKKDIKIFVLCAITGEILYFLCEYLALDYLPVSMITIMSTLVPLVSIIIERVILGVRSNWKINIGIVVGIIGVIFIIGVDFAKVDTKTAIGYALCLAAVLSWNAYNFLTSKLRGNYHTISIGITQMIISSLICAPFALRNLPSVEEITFQSAGAIVYLGIISAGCGYFCYIFALGKLGPTTNAVYSNFMPVSATIVSFILLGETIGLPQIVGGVIVITAGYIVIKEKGKIDGENLLKDIHHG